jgi:hypothetical protein
MRVASPFRRWPRGLRVLLIAAVAVTATSLADALAPTTVLIAVAALAMVAVTAAYLSGED